MCQVSLIVTTYNWPVALDAVLFSVAMQRTLPVKVIIADDGSGADTAAVVCKWQALGLFPIEHVWQENQGFRAAKIRNIALGRVSSDYVVFIDGDCILRSDFVQRHVQLMRPGFFVSGGRVLLKSEFTQQTLQHQWRIGTWPRTKFELMHVNRRMTLRYLPLGHLRCLFPKRWRGVKTCNLGVWYRDLHRVNGLDESFVGWGYEDSDLIVRLQKSGVKHCSGRFATTVLHLWHDSRPRGHAQENWQRFEAVLHGQRSVAAVGLNQYLAEHSSAYLVP